VVYVYVPFEISIYRNRNRERFVPEKMIMEQSDKIEKNFIVLKSKAYKSKVIPNFESEELMKAKRDIEEYPVPQAKRPPRPGDQGYGLAMAASMRVGRIARRMIGMTEDETEDWRDDIMTMVSRLEDMVEEVGEGDFSDLDEVKRCGVEIERGQVNLDDMVLLREEDVILREVAKVLNEAEGVRRWREDEDRKFRDRCDMISKEVKGLAEKFKRLGGRV
jgi:hypothetical protein